MKTTGALYWSHYIDWMVKELYAESSPYDVAFEDDQVQRNTTDGTVNKVEGEGNWISL